MDISKLRIEVDGSESWKTDKGNTAQRFFVHGMDEGRKYPKEVVRVLADGERLIQPGIYAIGGLYLDWGKLCVDYSKLVPVKTS